MALVVAPVIWISGDGFCCCCMLTIVCVCFWFKVASMISGEDEFQGSLWCYVLLKWTCVSGCSVRVLIVQNCWLCSFIKVPNSFWFLLRILNSGNLWNWWMLKFWKTQNWCLLSDTKFDVEQPANYKEWRRWTCQTCVQIKKQGIIV